MKKILNGYGYILTIGILLAVCVLVKYKTDLDSARASYITEKHYQSLEVVKKIDGVFNTFYEGLRIIAGLPGVKTIDRHAENFDYNARLAVQEIYKSIASTIFLSEIYIVPVDFNPDQIDPVTGKPEEPVIMFDGLIVGKTALSGDEDVEVKKKNSPQVEEIEKFEYAFLNQQLKWMKEFCPVENRLKDAIVPAYSGPEIITCDNTHFNPLKPDDRDRKGLVYSLPFYDLRGKLKGSISGIILSNVLAEYLPSGNYVLGNRKYQFTVTRKDFGNLSLSREYIQQIQPDPRLIYSEVLPSQIKDIDNEWYIWAGNPDAEFYARSDVVVARQFAILGFVGCLILTLGGILGYSLTRKHRKHLEKVNRELKVHQAMLERSRSLIKRFSGQILSTREEEKKRLGRDLHDMVGSMAVSLGARLRVTENEIKDANLDAAMNNLQQSRTLLDSIIKDFKKIAVNLRPPQLETIGLSGALRQYCTQEADHANLRLDLALAVDDQQVPEDLAIALYRVVQEAFNNVIRHARAGKVTVNLYQKNKSLYLIVEDNGVGFDPKDLEMTSTNFKMGLLGMRERIESFGGEFMIESEKDEGTRILAVIPFHAYSVRESAV